MHDNIMHKNMRIKYHRTTISHLLRFRIKKSRVFFLLFRISNKVLSGEKFTSSKVSYKKIRVFLQTEIVFSEKNTP